MDKLDLRHIIDECRPHIHDGEINGLERFKVTVAPKHFDLHLLLSYLNEDHLTFYQMGFDITPRVIGIVGNETEAEIEFEWRMI